MSLAARHTPGISPRSLVLRAHSMVERALAPAENPSAMDASRRTDPWWISDRGRASLDESTRPGGVRRQELGRLLSVERLAERREELRAIPAPARTVHAGQRRRFESRELLDQRALVPRVGVVVE